VRTHIFRGRLARAQIFRGRRAHAHFERPARAHADVMGKKRQATAEGELELPKKRQTSRAAKESEKRLIVVLEGAHLETCKVDM
jgi:hypothetical protein